MRLVSDARHAPGTRLGRDFFARPADAVARDLLGCTFTSGATRVRIVETEAYLGETDAACHARVGRTPRTATMYGPPGTLYVYLIYGLHWLVNIVCSHEGDPHAVLLRAAEPLPAPRAPEAPRSHPRLDGPGRLGAALGLDGEDDGRCVVDGRVSVRAGTPPRRIAVGPRIGVDYAGSWADAPLRFGDADSEALSRPFPDQSSPQSAASRAP